MTMSPPMSPPTSVVPPALRRPTPGRRCVRHDSREAVGRCVGCGAGFCHECITEHEGKLYCAPCFARRAGAAQKSSRQPGGEKRRAALLTTGSLLCLLVGFYLLGRLLSAVPPDFHDGTIWQEEFAP